MARFNAALNEVGDRSTCATGSLFEPVRGERFDLIATNPPFVISPGDRRAAGLPRLRAARRPGRRGHRPRRARPPHRRRLVPGAGQLGRSPRAGRGTSGSAGWLRRRLRRAGRAARGRRPGGVRRAVAQGRRPAATGGARTTAAATTPGWPGSRSRASRRSASAGSTCAAGGPRPARPPGLAVRRRAADRARDRRLGATAGRRRRPAPTSRLRASARDVVPGDRRRRPAPRTPRRSCCASSAACGGPGRSTPSGRAGRRLRRRADASGRSSTRSAAARPRRGDSGRHSRVRELVARASWPTCDRDRERRLLGRWRRCGLGGRDRGLSQCLRTDRRGAVSGPTRASGPAVE